MKKILFITIFSVFVLQPVYSKHQHLEKEYQRHWCNSRGGQLEYKLPDETRVDCLLPDMAVEFDFANKWAECIGQALYYGQITNRTPACVLIMENPQKDIRYLDRLKCAVSDCKNIQNFKVFTIIPEQVYTKPKINNQ